METDAIAFARFGLGRRSGEPLPADIRAWLHAQLDQADPTPTAGRPTSADGLALVAAVYEDNREHRAQGAAEAGMGGQPNPAALDTRGDAIHRQLHDHVQSEALDYFGNALITPAPFRERLVWFWVNHFTVTNRTAPSAATAGAYVREAIRPNVTGRFSDMLLAVMRHPAMLSYLDQNRSIGPDSPAGEAKHRGLNENLARECLELHTVTPASGYTQTDVTAFARILTGWGIDLKPPYGFAFHARAHEPGEQVVMGRTWPDGQQGGVAILQWLANHPATHHHLADKLVRHFVADDPPPDQVATIEAVLRRTDGDLGATSHALIELPGAWVPLTKLRTPQEYVVACLRAVGAAPDSAPHIVHVLAGLGQPLFGAPFPIGWPDRAADWAGPEALLQRVDFAYGVAGRMDEADAAAIGQEQLGALMPADLRTEIGRAGSRRDALTLLLASPEFQRR